MEYAEYEIMYEAEDTHWWYRGMRGAMFTLLRLRSNHRREPAILDAGCGSGVVSRYLATHFPTSRVIACDFSALRIAQAAEECSQLLLPADKRGGLGGDGVVD